MPRVESRLRTQKAVLWEHAGVDGYGQPLVSSPSEILVRWQNKQSEATQGDGSKLAINGSALVGRSIAVGSLLRFGPLDELPAEPTDLMQVIAYEENYDVKGRHAVRTVSFVRFADSLPTVEES